MKIFKKLSLVLFIPSFANCLTAALYSQKDIGEHYLNISKEYAQNFNYSVQKKTGGNADLLQFGKVLEGENRTLNVELLEGAKLNAWESEEQLSSEPEKQIPYITYRMNNTPIVQSPDDPGLNVYQDSTLPGAREIKKGETVKISLNRFFQDRMKNEKLEIFYLEKTDEGLITVRYLLRKSGAGMYKIDDIQEYKGSAKIKRDQRSYMAYGSLQALRYVLFPVALVLDVVSSPYQIYWYFTK